MRPPTDSSAFAESNAAEFDQKHVQHTKRWKRYEKPKPGHRLQMDVKFLAERIPGTRKRLYQFTAIADCTRIRVLGVSDDIRLFNDKLREGENCYNYHRPHSALDGQTPHERLLAKSRARTSPRS